MNKKVNEAIKDSWLLIRATLTSTGIFITLIFIFGMGTTIVNVKTETTTNIMWMIVSIITAYEIGLRRTINEKEEREQ